MDSDNRNTELGGHISVRTVEYYILTSMNLETPHNHIL